MYHIFSIVGARPQFVKASVLRRGFAQNSRFRETLLHTGQHYDAALSELIFDQLQIDAPDITLGISGGSHAEMTGRMLPAIEQALRDAQPDACLVYGDTNSTLAGALAAAKLGIPVLHVEAGLRAFNKNMPEEINRVVTDHLSALLFCPTPTALKNLADEGLSANAHLVGDIMQDAQQAVLGMQVKLPFFNGLSELEQSRPLAICTLHRAENTDDPERLLQLLKWLDDRAMKEVIIFPVHPRTRQAMNVSEYRPRYLRLIDPIGYLEMQALLVQAEHVYTDSGGLQKEAYFHRTPCTILRERTEWTELVDAGWSRFWTDRGPVRTPEDTVELYGEGQVGTRILDHISTFLDGIED